MMFWQRTGQTGESRWLHWPASGSWHDPDDRNLCFYEMCYSSSYKRQQLALGGILAHGFGTQNFGTVSYSWSRESQASVSWRNFFLRSYWRMTEEE